MGVKEQPDMSLLLLLLLLSTEISGSQCLPGDTEQCQHHCKQYCCDRRRSHKRIGRRVRVVRANVASVTVGILNTQDIFIQESLARVDPVLSTVDADRQIHKLVLGDSVVWSAARDAVASVEERATADRALQIIVIHKFISIKVLIDRQSRRHWVGGSATAAERARNNHIGSGSHVSERAQVKATTVKVIANDRNIGTTQFERAARAEGRDQ
jgi:hypothetical protein